MKLIRYTVHPDTSFLTVSTDAGTTAVYANDRLGWHEKTDIAGWAVWAEVTNQSVIEECERLLDEAETLYANKEIERETVEIDDLDLGEYILGDTMPSNDS